MKFVFKFEDEDGNEMLPDEREKELIEAIEKSTTAADLEAAYEALFAYLEKKISEDLE